MSLLPRSSDVRGLQLGFSLKLVAQQLADSHTEVRQAALDFMQLAHRVLGTEFWSLLGRLRDNDLQSLEQHLGEKAPQIDLTCDSLVFPTPLIHTESKLVDRSVTSFVHPLLSAMSSRRAHSPPPVHTSPAALNVVLPLLRKCNDMAASASARTTASEELNYALSCLVDQLRVSDLSGTLCVEEKDSDCQPDRKSTESNEDEADCGIFSNVIVGALVDMETLILDSRTCNLLVPFVGSIVNHLSRLFHNLSSAKFNTAGHIIFLNCLAGLLVVLFEQPFLAREVGQENLMLLLVCLLQLADDSFPPVQGRLRLDSRRSIALRLAYSILSFVPPTVSFSGLLRLLSIAFFEIDCGSSESVRVSRTRSARRSASSEPTEIQQLRDKLAQFPRIRELVLSQLHTRLATVTYDFVQLDCAIVLPMIDRLLKSTSTVNHSAKAKNRRQSQCSSDSALYHEVEGSLRFFIVTAYATIGPSMSDVSIKMTGERSCLTSYLNHLKQLMPNAPYAHCA